MPREKRWVRGDVHQGYRMREPAVLPGGGISTGELHRRLGVAALHGGLHELRLAAEASARRAELKRAGTGA